MFFRINLFALLLFLLIHLLAQLLAHYHCFFVNFLMQFSFFAVKYSVQLAEQQKQYDLKHTILISIYTNILSVQEMLPVVYRKSITKFSDTSFVQRRNL